MAICQMHYPRSAEGCFRWDATHPATWGAGDTFQISGWYKTA